MHSLRFLAGCLAACALHAGSGYAQGTSEPERPNIAPVQRFNFQQDIGIDQKLGDKLPLDLRFRDESGQEVELGRYFGDRPVILSFVYYECPMLCTEVLNEQTRMLRVLALEPGKDFQIVTVSIDPRDKPELAAKKKVKQADAVKREGVSEAWHFLCGEQDAITALTKAAGFRYVYDEEQKQYAHAGGVIIVTPKGELSRYFYGIDYNSRDVKLALVEAGEGKVGTLVDQFLMLCYHYDPITGTYGLAAMTVIRGLGVLTVFLIAGYVVHMLRRERRAARSTLCVAAEAANHS